MLTLHRFANCLFTLSAVRLVCTQVVQFGHLPNMMQAVQIKPHMDRFLLYLGEVPRPEPKAGEVLIKVKATAINRADVLQKQGLYPIPPGVSDILGLEAAGEIFAKGPECNGQWKVGDRVMALLNGGGYAEYVTCPESQLMRIPANLDFSEAAAIPEAWITAYQLLHTIGNVQAGDYVLIHGGASGVGTAAIQLCVQAGACPIVTAGSHDKVTTAKNLGAVAGFNYKQDKVVDEVMKVTGGKGVNLLLDCVGGTMAETNANVLAMDGKWIVYGLMGGGEVSGQLLRKVLSKRLTMIGTTLRSRSLQYKKELVGNFSTLALPLFEKGTFKPIIHTILTLDKAQEAHTQMENNANVGKIVLAVPEGLTSESNTRTDEL